MIQLRLALIVLFYACCARGSLKLQEKTLPLKKSLLELFTSQCSVIQSLHDFCAVKELDLSKLTEHEFNVFREYLLYCQRLDQKLLTPGYKKNFLKLLMSNRKNFATLALCCDFYGVRRVPKELSYCLEKQFKSQTHWQEWVEGKKSPLFLKLPPLLLCSLVVQLHQKLCLKLRQSITFSTRDITFSSLYDKDYQRAQFSPSGNLLALQYLSTVLIYEKGKFPLHFTMPNVVRSMMFFDENNLAVGTSDGCVCMIETDSRTDAYDLIARHHEPIDVFAKCSSDQSLLIGSRSMFTKYARNAIIWSTRHHPADLVKLVFNTKGTVFASGDRLGNVITWDASTGEVKKKLHQFPTAVCHLSYANSDVLYAVALSGDQPMLWVENYAHQKPTILEPKSYSKTNISFFEKLIQVNDPHSFKIIEDAENPRNSMLFLEPDEINCCSLVSYNATDKVLAFDPAQKKLLVKKLFNTQTVHRLCVYDLAELIQQSKAYETLTAKQLFFLYHATHANDALVCNDRLAKCYYSLPGHVKKDLEKSSVAIKIPKALSIKYALPKKIRSCFTALASLFKQEWPDLRFENMQ